MKKIAKNFTVSALVLAILCTIVSVPAVAGETTSVYYKSNFNDGVAGRLYDSAYFPSSQSASAGSSLSSEMFYASKTDNAGSPLNGGDRDAASYVQRGDGDDVAFRFGKSQDGTNSYTIGVQLYPNALTLTKEQGQIFHISFDMLAEDTKANKVFAIRRSSDREYREIVKFGTDGTLTIWGDSYISYTTDKWYAFDIYFDFDANMVYAYLDGKLAIVKNDTYFPGSTYTFDILKFYTVTNLQTGMCIDNLEVSVMDSTAVELPSYSLYYSERYSMSGHSGTFSHYHFTNAQMYSGLFGKSASDVSVNLGNAGDDGNAAFPDVYLSKVSPTAGDVVHYSTLLAVDPSLVSDKRVYLYSADYNLLKIHSDGAAVATTCAENINLSTNQWYRFDFVMTITDASGFVLDAYVNGTPYLTGEYIDADLSNEEILTRYFMNNGDGGMYLDDIVMGCTSDADLLVIPKIRTVGERVSVGADKVVCSGGYTVEEFMENTQANVPFEVRDIDGNKITTGDLDGNIVVLIDSIGGDVYLPAEADGPPVPVNYPPELEILGITDGNSYRPSQLSEVEVLASDSDGIDRVEFYMDGKLVGKKTEAPYTFDISDCALGEHSLKAVAYDSTGKSADSVVNVFVVYSAPVPLDGVITIYDVNGRVKSTGNSGELLKNENLTVEYSTEDSPLITELDITFSDLSVKAASVVRVKDSSDVNRDVHEILKFEDGNVIFCSAIIGTYEAGVAYRLTMYTDPRNNLFIILLVNKASGVITAQGQTPIYGVSYKSLSFVRLRCTDGGVDSKIILEDMKATILEDYPYVTDISDNYSSVGVILNSASYITCTFTRSIGDISKENVNLQNDIGKVTVSSVEKLSSNVVKITPKSGFVPGCSYTVTFNNLELSSGTVSQIPIVAYFSTSPNDVDVTEGYFAVADDITFTAKLENISQSKSVTVVLVTYENGVMKDITFKTADAENGDTYISTPAVTMPAVNPSVEAFVIDGWSTRLPVSSKIFKYNFD